MSAGARGCVLLVWLVAEVVTDDPESACVSVCSLHTTDGRDNKSEKTKTKTNGFCFHVKFCCTFSFCLFLIFFVCWFIFVSNFLDVSQDIQICFFEMK